MAWDVLSGVAKKAWDVMSGVTKTTWDVLSRVANRCLMFCPGCQKMASDVLSRDVLSYIPFMYIECREPNKTLFKSLHLHAIYLGNNLRNGVNIFSTSN